MVKEWIGVADVLVISLGAGVLAYRSGLLGERGRVWRTCLFWAAWGAVLVMSMDLLEFGVADALSLTNLFVVAVGTLGGALSGLFLSYMERRWPS